MTAKEMFKNLGYYLYRNGDLELSYRKCCDGLEEIFTFWLNTKEYNSIFCDREEIDIRDITFEEHKAIHQQCKELGWLDD